jgi:hypothetical protein
MRTFTPENGEESLEAFHQVRGGAKRHLTPPWAAL